MLRFGAKKKARAMPGFVFVGKILAPDLRSRYIYQGSECQGKQQPGQMFEQFAGRFYYTLMRVSGFVGFCDWDLFLQRLTSSLQLIVFIYPNSQLHIVGRIAHNAHICAQLSDHKRKKRHELIKHHPLWLRKKTKRVIGQATNLLIANRHIF
jgi:hypothetical protein